jgi:hypothetical protein
VKDKERYSVDPLGPADIYEGLHLVLMIQFFFLFSIGIFWLWSANMSFIRIDPREVLSCGIFYNILLGSTTLSNLFLASFSIDRSVMIVYPARYRSIVTQSRIILRLILITIIVIFLLIPRHFYFRYNSRTTLFLCELYPSADRRRIRLWTLMHATLFVSVPSLIICICWGILLHNRCKHKRLHKNKLSASARRMHRRSILIFLVSLWFFLSLLATGILEIWMVHERFHDLDSQCSTRWKFYKILLNCLLTLLSISYSNKFYIHLIISTTARQILIQLITCRSDQKSSIPIRMNDRNNNEQGLLVSIHQTEEKSIEKQLIVINRQSISYENMICVMKV